MAARFYFISGIIVSLAAAEAQAQQIEAPAGELVVNREVGPRNAFNPGGNAPTTVDTSPNIGGLTGIRQLSDLEAAGITGSLPGGQLLPQLSDNFTIADPAPLLVGGAAHSSGGGIISRSIDTGMGALNSGLSALGDLGQ